MGDAPLESVHDYGKKGSHGSAMKLKKSGGESGGVGESCTTVTQRVGTKLHRARRGGIVFLF